ncbi:MAG: FliA/WhiG family RNA polymerase sigma factor [Planctomycetota bacterium]
MLSEEERERLILEHVPLLHHIVGRMALDLPSRVDRDDLVGYGMLGLIGAADAFDPSRGLQFSTFAFPRIRGAILDELRRQDFLPRGRRERVRDLDRVVRELEQDGGAPPSPEQIAEALGTTLDEVDEILASARSAAVASLDEGPSEQLAMLVRDPRCEDPMGSVEWEETKELLVEAIASLPEVEKNVITLYYAEGLLLREIGELLEVTESRVSQLHSRALYRLNQKLSSAVEPS